MVFGCQKNTEKQISDKANLSNEIHFIQEYYSPLDATRFSAVLNDTQNFCGILIYYSKPWASLSIPLNSGSDDNLFSDFNSCQGELLNTGKAHYNDFTASEVQDIFNYLSQNSDYFFSGEEYEGIYPPPIEATTIFDPVCSGEYEYAFSLHICKPYQMAESWTIHKCIDEYPYPDHPLYELFELLEDDFISQFE